MSKNLEVELSPEILADPRYQTEVIWTQEEAEAAAARFWEYSAIVEEEEKQHPGRITQRRLEALIRAELQMRRLEQYWGAHAS
jgi:hypothetical protein